MIHLPPNPSRFDYLHAIRALASRTGQTEILDLADKAMDMDETDEAQRLLARLCRAEIGRAHV